MDREPDWDLYRTFLAVLREGSMSGAARALRLTQPTIARHVEALEQAIGADLFVRTQRGLSPTDAGLELEPYVQSIASASAALLRTASGHGDHVAGVVRISASEVVGVEFLPPVLTRLRERHPQLVIELSLSDEIDDLLRREADIAVRMVEPTQQSLVCRKVGALPLGLHAHEAYLARRGAPVTLDDLPSHDLIGYDVATPAIRALLSSCPQLRHAAFALRVDSNIAQLAAIRAGFGIGVCQAAIAARDPHLVRLMPEAFSVDLPVWVVMHENLKRSARCRAVFDALASADYLV